MKKPYYLVLFSLIVILSIIVPAYAYGGGYYYGGYYYGGYYHGGYYHGGGHVIVNGGFWFGPGWGWGPRWWGPAGYPYPYHSYPPYVIQQPSLYEMQAPQQHQEYYWYFCPDSKNYYPYVKQCPKGWLKVVPPKGPSW